MAVRCEHNCHLCRYEWLGRCGSKDVSIDDLPICSDYEYAGTREHLREIKYAESLGVKELTKEQLDDFHNKESFEDLSLDEKVNLVTDMYDKLKEEISKLNILIDKSKKVVKYSMAEDEFIEGINILNKNFDLLELHSMLEYINTYNEN